MVMSNAERPIYAIGHTESGRRVNFYDWPTKAQAAKMVRLQYLIGPTISREAPYEGMGWPKPPK